MTPHRGFIVGADGNRSRIIDGTIAIVPYGDVTIAIVPYGGGGDLNK